MVGGILWMVAYWVLINWWHKNNYYSGVYDDKIMDPQLIRNKEFNEAMIQDSQSSRTLGIYNEYKLE